MSVRFGDKLPADEYTRLVFAALERATRADGVVDNRQLERVEFELLIDHRLGREFPEARRRALWETRERIDSSAPKWIPIRVLANFSGRRARTIRDAYREVLSEEELKEFLGDDADLESFPVPSIVR